MSLVKLKHLQLNIFFNARDFSLDYDLSQVIDDQDQIAFERSFFNQVSQDKGLALVNLALVDLPNQSHDGLFYLKHLSDTFKNRVLTSMQGHVTPVHLSIQDYQNLIKAVPFAYGAHHVDENWLDACFDTMLAAIKRHIKKFGGTVKDYYESYSPQGPTSKGLEIHITEDPHEGNHFVCALTWQVTSGNRIYLRQALEPDTLDPKAVESLAGQLVKMGHLSQVVASLIETREIYLPVRLSPIDAYRLLSEMVVLAENGIGCHGPKWWQAKPDALPLGLALTVDKEDSQKGWFTFKPQLVLNHQVLSEHDITALHNHDLPLFKLGDKWQVIDPDNIKGVVDHYWHLQDTLKDQTFEEARALRDTSKLFYDLYDKFPQVDLEGFNAWLMDRLDKKAKSVSLPLDWSLGFNAILRPYQTWGLEWLLTMQAMGLGCCLADDMGLGKTVQVIALYHVLKASRPLNMLIVVPASILDNWVREFARFSPTSRVSALYKVDQTQADGFDLKSSVAIVSYAMLPKMQAILDTPWDVVVLDEAQAIKNARTQKARASKALKANFRIGLTGTPIENSTLELWSLFDFLNPGMLGSLTRFKKMTQAMHHKHYNYNRLRDRVGPFLLRRLKTDPKVISDLPDKIELKAYADLSPKQVMHYKDVVSQVSGVLKDYSGISRRGLILSSLMKLKQICNHPDHYLKGTGFASHYSGKMTRLVDIAQAVHEAHESMLVFTQFKAMTQPLADLLEGVFGRPGLVLHGSVPVTKRQSLIDQFNGEGYVPFMVLSLKAGGTGLNLTAANHVVHFDRWWNPSVENQATDRSFRIGQTKHVMVHKLICKGTIEENIDALMEAKLDLFNEVVGQGSERWLTELDSQTLLDLFAYKEEGDDGTP